MKIWGVISAVAAGIVLIVDAFTKSIGVIGTVIAFVCGQPTPIVVLAPIDMRGGGTCLEFAFSNLPEDFSLGKIHLRIIRANGPTPISGHMAARSFERVVNMKLSPSILSGETKEIEFRAAFEAEKRNDIAYVDFCPVLTMPGQGGELHVAPTFYSPDGSLIEGIKIATSDDTPVEQGVRIDLSRPKNAVILLDETRFQLVPR